MECVDVYPCNGSEPSRCTKGKCRLNSKECTFEEVFGDKRENVDKGFFHFGSNVFFERLFVHQDDLLRRVITAKNHFHSIEEEYYILLSIFLILPYDLQ